MTSGHDSSWWEAGQAERRDEPEEPRVVVRDRRRIDPDSGEVRPDTAASTPAGAAAAPSAPADEEGGELVASLRQQVGERTADLQRLKAEFDNYRRRVERDRQQIAEQATAKLMASLLSTLDDIGRARDHGDLEGPFKAIAESLETTLEAAGLERYGAPGDEFDPAVHEALMHSYRSDVTGPTCVDVFRAGYLHAGRVVRPAQVAVAEPAGDVDLGERSAEEAPPAADVAAPGEANGAGEASAAEPNRPTPPPPPTTPPPNERPGPIPDDTGSVPRPDHGGPTVSAD